MILGQPENTAAFAQPGVSADSDFFPTYSIFVASQISFLFRQSTRPRLNVSAFALADQPANSPRFAATWKLHVLRDRTIDEDSFSLEIRVPENAWFDFVEMGSTPSFFHRKDTSQGCRSCRTCRTCNSGWSISIIFSGLGPKVMY